MALNLNNPFGDLSGKVGGTIFQRTRGGSIVRRCRQIKHRQSISQLNRSATFRAFAGTWSKLTNLQRQAWYDFNLTYFKPKGEFTVGAYSPFNAYLACTRVMAAANLSMNVEEIRSFPGDVVLDIDPNYYSHNGNAPAINVQPSIMDVDSNIYPIYVSTVASIILSTGNYRFHLDFFGTPPGGVSFAPFHDPLLVKLGFDIYLSEPLRFENEVPRNPYHFLLASTSNTRYNVGSYDNLEGIVLLGSIDPNYVQVPFALVKDQWFKVTLMVLGDKGSYAVSNSIYLKVENPL